MLTKKDTETLRALGGEYMGFAVLPVQKQKRDLWKALNHSAMKRPMVNIEQLPWNELEKAGGLACEIEDPYWRGIESELRRTLYQWRNFPADMVLEPFITLPIAVQSNWYGVQTEADTISLNENDTAKAQYYHAVIEDEKDIEKIKDVDFSYDKEESMRRLDEAEAIFSGIAPVILSHGVSFHLGVWDKLSMYLNVENIFYDFIDRPEFLHAALTRITDATIAGIHRANELRIVDDIAKTAHCSYVYNDELLPDFGRGKGSVSANSWAFGLAQILTSTSPDTFEEFELPYITRMANEFGMIYYGCCDRLDNKLDLVRKIPHVKKVSCSPWSDRRAFAEKIGGSLIMSNKPTPAYLASGFDMELIRNDIDETCRLARENNANLELILKDVSTVEFDPSRLAKWEQAAMAAVQE